MLIVFCGGKIQPDVLLTSLQEAYGATPIVGGSAAGVIARQGFGYSGLEVGVLAFLEPRVTPVICSTHALLASEHASGQDLGRQIAGVATNDAFVLMFFDSVSAVAPPRLHPASEIVEGFQHGLNGRNIELVGGGMLADLNFSDGWIFDGDAVARHAAVALVFPGGLCAETMIFHGCVPVSTFMTITRIEGAEVFELDGKRALDVIEQQLNFDIAGGTEQSLSLIATLGQKQGDPFAPYDENAYVNRLILTCDRARGSVTIFEPDFSVGTRVQIMSRDSRMMVDSVRKGVEIANRAIGRGESLFSLYVDCAGRASVKSGAVVEEADILRSAINQSTPFVGFYSGVEIAPFNGRPRPLDWTGVLATVRFRPT
jgi:hypothetical protein